MRTNKVSLETNPYNAGASRWTIRLPDIIAVLVIVLTIAFLTLLAIDRSLAGYGTETDFIGTMVGEAERALAGAPLESRFHPPFFALTLAAAYSIAGDWMIAGKAITLISAAVTLLSNYVLFRVLFNGWIGLGAVLGLTSGAIFLDFSTQATSDVFALALYSLTFLGAALAAAKRSLLLWFVVGLLIILTLMARTNGLTLVVLIAIPLLQSGMRYKLSGLFAGFLGIGAAILAFIGFANATGSSLMPEGTYHNLALTYFTDERIAWEGMIEARGRFNSLTEVLLYDPARMIKIMVRNLYDVSIHKLPFLAGPILALFFLPGLVIAAVERRNLVFIAFLVATVGQLLLVNLKAYEPRYHMYILPWIGAGSILFVDWILSRRDMPHFLRLVTAAIVFAPMLIGPLTASREATRFAAHDGNPELAAALPQVDALMGPGDAFVGRKLHLAFYTGAEHIWLPELASEDDLLMLFEELAKEERITGALYLFVGQIERARRPDIVAMVAPGLDFLTPVASGDSNLAQWTMYRYTPVSGS